MATCRDCFNENLCSATCGVRYYGGYEENVEKKCRHFKDKSKIVELPVTVGDRVYYINTKPHIALYQNKIYEATVVRVVIIGIGCSLVIQIQDESGCCEIPEIKDFGETVFTSKDEAENKLKELTRQDG